MIKWMNNNLVFYDPTIDWTETLLYKIYLDSISISTPYVSCLLMWHFCLQHDNRLLYVIAYFILQDQLEFLIETRFSLYSDIYFQEYFTLRLYPLSVKTFQFYNRLHMKNKGILVWYSGIRTVGLTHIFNQFENTALSSCNTSFLMWVIPSIWKPTSY